MEDVVYIEYNDRKLSPMMRQYRGIKEKHEGEILFYRLGDFYEMFFGDAVTASQELGLTLTGRDCGYGERTPMCGVPHHACESYAAKLVKKGYKVAICEQTEAKPPIKGLVSREVIRIITPGTVVEDSMLDETRNNFMAAAYITETSVSLCLCDISTGTFLITDLNSPDRLSKLAAELDNHAVSEILLVDSTGAGALDDYLSKNKSLTVTELSFENEDVYINKFTEHFGGGSAEFACIAGGMLLDYLCVTQKSAALSVNKYTRYYIDSHQNLPPETIRNLELFETIYRREAKGSLISVIDKTKTAMGKRLLRMYLTKPLLNADQINKRLSAVECLHKDAVRRQEIRGILAKVCDIERLCSRMTYGLILPRELKSLEQAISCVSDLKELIKPLQADDLKEIDGQMDALSDVCALVHSALSEEPPALMHDDGKIKEGYSEELDGLRRVLADSKARLADIELRERERTGIRNLKITNSRVFGYCLEAPKSSLSLVPGDYIRKQTLAGAERYVTDELKCLEDEILTASDRAVLLDNILFEELREKVCRETARIQATAGAVAKLDVFASLAETAAQNGYVKPEILPGNELYIKDGRHPVVECFDKTEFVPNDTVLDGENVRVAVLTGPNMSGKSTYMRQMALITLMAHIGSFVPASRAVIGIVDGIFTRIGASDDLSTGRSTFMLEMSEVSTILKSATSRSLLIIDEIGRGTSTRDGMSIARAVLEHIADKEKLGAKTLFATHFHELTELEGVVGGVVNLNVSVTRNDDGIIFSRKVIRGRANHSYGIEVSKLAGLPRSVIERARELRRLTDMNFENRA